MAWAHPTTVRPPEALFLLWLALVGSVGIEMFLQPAAMSPFFNVENSVHCEQ